VTPARQLVITFFICKQKGHHLLYVGCPVPASSGNVVMWHTYQLNLDAYVNCNLEFVTCCNFSELSGIDGPFTPDWLENSDGLVGCCDSVRESLIRVNLELESLLVHCALTCLFFSRLTYDDCLEDKREDCQNCSMLYRVLQ